MQRQQPQPQQSQAQHSEQGNGAFDHASGDHSALRLQATVVRGVCWDDADVCTCRA